MPGFAVHLELAQAILADLSSGPDPPPFPVEDPACRAALFAGCCAPDMGNFPGGDLLLSDLAHYIRSADLARSLLRLARTGVERATAWGWATHLLGDVLIHPLVNRGAAELMGLGPDRTLSFHQSPWAHVRVELGLDAYVLSRGAGAGWPIPTLDREGLALLDRAFRETYALPAGHPRLPASNRAWARFAPWLLAAARSERVEGRREGLRDRALRLLRRMSGRFARTSLMYAFTHPVTPPVWLLSEYHSALASFPERFQSHARQGFEHLANFNLDTGSPEDDEPDYPLRTRAVLSLQERTRQTRPASELPAQIRTDREDGREESPGS